MIVYRTDEYGNLQKKICQMDVNGNPVFDDRKWSIEPSVSVYPDEVALCLNGKWDVKNKNLGTWYHKKSPAIKREITKYDPTFNPDDYTQLEPCEYPKWDGDKWIIDTELKNEIEESKNLAELGSVDSRSIRPLRAVLTAMLADKTPDAADVAMLTDLETEAKNKRSK